MTFLIHLQLPTWYDMRRFFWHDCDKTMLLTYLITSMGGGNIEDSWGINSWSTFSSLVHQIFISSHFLCYFYCWGCNKRVIHSSCWTLISPLFFFIQIIWSNYEFPYSIYRWIVLKYRTPCWWCRCIFTFIIVGQLTRKLVQMTTANSPCPIVSITNLTPATTLTSMVNIVQVTSSRNPQQPRGKNKNNNKSKKCYF